MNQRIKSFTGLSLPILVILAVLGAPRVFFHDLHLVDPHGTLNLLLAVVPFILWIGFVLVSKTNKPFQALLTIGIIYGLYLGVIHLVLWVFAFDTPPVLGGNLSGMAPALQAVLMRGFMLISSLVTGAVTGAVTGLIGWLLHLVLHSQRQQ
ncbi:hypothetical protein [Paenibacillus apis]|uniref:Uncharacterized protein n=1 Tax=Paenibacillus apis TaxID=1792174 RepID=A0A919Y4U7_9BACL|nr:hypothetical protein [Paenibacillus apis]GIO44131.1 hypothetical protein J41TS4_38890 [Paenibacillus apis]